MSYNVICLERQLKYSRCTHQYQDLCINHALQPW